MVGGFYLFPSLIRQSKPINIKGGVMRKPIAPSFVGTRRKVASPVTRASEKKGRLLGSSIVQE